MQQIVEATIDRIGQVKLDKKIRLDRKHKALVTILDEEPEYKSEKSIVGSLEIIDDDLESASAEISKMFLDSIERSGKELND